MTAQTILPANSVSGGFDVANSMHFDGTSNHNHKTPSSSGSQRKFTFSAWVKKTDFSSGVLLSSGEADGNPNLAFYFDSSSRINMYSTQGMQYITTRVFRDAHAWYHFMFVVDTASSNANNRQQLYVNGVRETVFTTSTVIGQNTDLSINTGDYRMSVGTGVDDEDYFGGYMAEVVFLDNQALGPTSFGEFDEDSGIWKPMAIAGSAAVGGTNGFYLDFQASGNLGNDVFGGTDLTEVNVGALNQKTDTCTNNFCTLTPLTKLTDATLQADLCRVTYGTNSTRRAVFGSMVFTAGKWYCETKVTATSQTSVEMSLGISNTYNPEAIGNALISANGFTVSLFPSNGSLYIGSTRDEQGLGNLAVNDIVGMALDMDNGTLQFSKNGSALGSANSITTGDSDDGELYPGFTVVNSCSSGGQTFTASHNFGNPTFSGTDQSDENGFGSFEYAPPSGFLAMCTKNLAENGG